MAAKSQFSITTCRSAHTGTECSPGNIPSLLSSTFLSLSERRWPSKKKKEKRSCYQEMEAIITESFSLPDFVHIWALLCHVQDHDCLDVKVENRISPVSKRWHLQSDRIYFHFSNSFSLLMCLFSDPSMVYILVPGTTGPLFCLSEFTMAAEFMALADFSFLL